MSIDNFLYSAGRRESNEGWKGTFQEYVDIAIKTPSVTDLATKRIYNMIMNKGTTVKNGRTIYKFFDGKIMGAERQIEQIMMYLKGASMGLDIKKRVLLLLGPPGGGKSMILSLLKKELALYSRTDKGAIYSIQGCPLNEDPMHLIPERDRADMWNRYGIHIEGKLCPYCQFRFENDWKRNLNHVPVERVYIHEDNRVGIGTFAPAEKNDMSELYGSVDLSSVDYYGDSGDVRAYSFNGELHKANRGIMEFIEILKAKSDFLHVLLTLAEEQQFKTPRFPLQYVDEALIAHTNEGEFYRFISVKENEAIIDRLFIVQMPYNMEVENEEQIYHHALKSKLKIKGAKVHPGAIRLASEFTIHTRRHKDPLRNGMSGISPRFILNSLAIALVNSPNHQVLPQHMLETLKDQVNNYPVLSMETREDYMNFLTGLQSSLIDYDRPKPRNPRTDQQDMLDIIIGD